MGEIISGYFFGFLIFVPKERVVLLALGFHTNGLIGKGEVYVIDVGIVDPSVIIAVVLMPFSNDTFFHCERGIKIIYGMNIQGNDFVRGN